MSPNLILPIIMFSTIWALFFLKLDKDDRKKYYSFYIVICIVISSLTLTSNFKVNYYGYLIQNASYDNYFSDRFKEEIKKDMKSYINTRLSTRNYTKENLFHYYKNGDERIKWDMDKALSEYYTKNTVPSPDGWVIRDTSWDFRQRGPK